MNTYSSHQATKPAGTPIRDGEHYRHLLGRAKWYILISGPVVLLIAAAIVFLVIRPENPELIARTLIGLERTPGVSGAKTEVSPNLGREDIMMSRTFLRDVVQKLSLQLWTVPYSRKEMFDSASIDSSALCGTYCVRFNPHKNGEFLIDYYDTTAISLPVFGMLHGGNSKIVASGNWADDMPVRMTGMALKFSRSIRTRPYAFTFHVVNIRLAVETVYRNLTIKRADPEKGVNYIAVLMAGRDYSLAAVTANAIADAFIEKNLSFSQSRTRGIVESLDKQLRLAEDNLASAESKIRDYRLANPQVGLNQQTQQTVSNLARLDNGIQNTSAGMVNATHLKNEYLNADSSQRLRIAGAMVDLLSAQAVPAAKTLSEEFNRLLSQQHEMTDKYGAEHPLVLENNRAIKKVSGAISAALDEFLGSAQSALSKKQQNVQQLSRMLRQLPAQEMQLGELERNQKIFADIYSAVLGSYNQSKVAHAVETADFYVMDYAVAPLPPPADRSRLIIVCLLIAILASFGPVLAYDFFDSSVRSQRQLSRITGSSVLEAIPFFFQADDKRRSRHSDVHPLINVPCDPNFTREIFDSLLVKIKLRMTGSADHCIVVSSFEGGSGKSTMSANLAMAIAMRGHRVLLVDGDLRRGTVKEIFQLPESGGLAALLSGDSPLTDDDCKRSILETKIPGLYVLPSGLEPSNPGTLLSSPRMEEFRRFCGKYSEYMIMDTPPLGVVSDAAAVQKLFAHYIFVVRSGKTKVAQLVTRINEFDGLPEKILGYVLNGASHEAVGTYRRYSNYYSRSYPLKDNKRYGSTLIKHKSVVRSSAIMLIVASFVGLGIAGMKNILHSPKKGGQLQVAIATTDSQPQPGIEPLQQAPMSVPDQSISKGETPRNKSGTSATHAKKKNSKIPGAIAPSEPIAASKTATSENVGETTAGPLSIDSTESVLAILREIRSKFSQGDMAGLDSIFNNPPINDGEYYLWLARYLCDTGGWRKALPFLEKALTTPARAFSGDQLTKEYFICKAKCLSAAFSAEPTPAHGTAAMEAWYDVKYQFRGSSQDSRYLYANNELRRISSEVNGK